MDSSNKDAPDLDFVWEDYLEETKSLAAPPTAFIHVEHSLESGFKEGMKMEVPNKEKDDHYWLASVIMTCGPLLSIRYAGYGDDRSADFWLDVKSGDVHPVGWCQKNSKTLIPPRAVRERHKDIGFLLSKELNGACTVPATLLSDPSAGMTPIDQIKTDMKVEVIDEHNPEKVWIATIIQNIGGRLHLRYDGIPGNTDNFWLFYLSPRIHEIGWAKSRGFTYAPPEDRKFQHTDEKWNGVMLASMKAAQSFHFPDEVLEPQLPIEEHHFEVGMKLEALNPETLLEICPATVLNVVNKFYFLVGIDSYTKDEDDKQNMALICCHSNSDTIFPVNWAAENHLELTCPEGYKDSEQSEKFDWQQYLSFCNAKAAPSDLFLMSFMNLGLEVEMKLEAVNPFAPDQVCVATVKKVTEPLMWIRLESIGLHSSEIITTVGSFDIFPVGWCGSNGYPLQAPALTKPRQKYLKAPSQSKEADKPIKNDENGTSTPKEQSKAWCPRIYFNHRCFSGPLLSKGRLAELPKQVGPGPIALVMKEVLTLLINVAYKSSRVLSELQLRGKTDSKMQHQIIKAKYRGKSYRATVEFIRSCDQLEEFCRMICKKLDCCPYLFGPFQVGEDCPEKCHSLTKTKFGYTFMKKQKKPGRPPLAPVVESPPAVKKGSPGRKKKRIHWRFIRAQGSAKKQRQDSDSEEKTESEDAASVKRSSDHDDSDGACVEREKKKLKTAAPVKSDIVTRGAKLPNFGLEMKWRHNVSSFLPRKKGRPPGRPSLSFSGKKIGRPLGSKAKIIIPSAVKHLRNSSQTQSKEIEKKVPIILDEKPKLSGLNLKTDPLMWSVDEVARFIRNTECAPMAWLLKEQEIDGQALLMLTLPFVQDFLNLKLGPAKLLCTLVEKVKFEYVTRFAPKHS